MGLDFVAIDFETACSQLCSICAVGLARVRDGIVVDSAGILVNPQCDFGHWNTKIHGIRKEDVASSPTWAEVWPQVKEYIGDDVLISHNAPFDMAVLRSALEAINEPFDFASVCTLQLSMGMHPEKESHKLIALCEEYGIQLDNHDPTSDAEGCAQLAILLAQEAQLADADRLLAYCANLASEKKQAKNAVQQFDESTLVADAIFRGKKVLFTGELYSLDRKRAREIVKRLGAHTPSEIRADLDYLVVGEKGVPPWQSEGRDRKVKLAQKLQQAGSALQIVNEETFIKWLTGEEAVDPCGGGWAVTYQNLFDRTVAACDELHRPFVAMNLVKDDKYMSVYFYDQLALKYVILKAGAYVEVDDAYVNEPNGIAMLKKHVVNTAGSKWRFTVDAGFDWQAFSVVLAAICADAREGASAEPFGCCSLFTACSDAKKCLRSDEPEYLGCYYRRNLEAGRIFYGKNKNI